MQAGGSRSLTLNIEGATLQTMRAVSREEAHAHFDRILDELGA
jgi:hypothetical protein